MGNIKACIFDLDGVIVDSAKYHFTAWQELAQSMGIDFTIHDNEQLKGVSRMESLQYILNKGNLEKTKTEKEELAKIKNEHYVQLIDQMDQSEILEGIVPFLDELQQAHIRIALGSASKNARHILENTDLLHRFEVIIDGTRTTKSKPDPQVFLMGAAELGFAPEDCIVFEDALKGIEAAKAGHFKSVGVGDADILSLADFVIPNFKNFTLQDLLMKY